MRYYFYIVNCSYPFESMYSTVSKWLDWNVYMWTNQYGKYEMIYLLCISISANLKKEKENETTIQIDLFEWINTI